MKQKDYHALADQIIKLLGGAENVSFYTRCVTRLRFHIKDRGEMNKEAIEGLSGVYGTQWQADEFQIIIGQDVGNAYEEIVSILGDSVSEVEENKVEKNSLHNLINKMCNTLSACILPVLSTIIGVGMIKVVLTVIGPNVCNLVGADNSTIIFLNFVSDAGFYFLPAFVGYTSAKYFKTNEVLGILMGVMMISPAFIELVESGANMSFFGIPIIANSYANAILPLIIIVWIMSNVYRFIDRFIPASLKSLIVPALTIVIMIPVAFCAIGPLSSVISNYLMQGLLWLNEHTGGFAVAIATSWLPLVIIFGLSGASVTIGQMMLAQYGYEIFWIYPAILFNTTLGVALFAVYLKQKKAEMLPLSITAMFGGVSEPGLFGYMVKNQKALISLMVALFFGGLYGGFSGVKNFAVTSGGIFGIVGTIGPESSIVHAFIGLAISWILAFVLTYYVALKKK